LIRPVFRQAPLIALLLGVSGVLFGPGHMPEALAQAPREYEIKAAFIYNFIKFVEWPAQALPDTSPTITIGVLGRGPFGGALESLNGKTVKGKRLVVRQLTGTREIGSVHVLFVSASERDSLDQIVSAARGANVLTVGEMAGFARSGGIINLTTQSNKIRFEINPEAAERAGLRISSQLLRLAKVVRA
jgi:hypothetical protein